MRFSIVATTVLAQCFISCFSADVIVNTSKGRIRGYIGGPKQNRINIFKGIPFVAPPIGKNRFSKPKSVQPWDGILDTTRYRAACMSDTTYTSTPQKNISEDCLYLNVFADPHCTKSECAVVVYIHGGSFYFQSATMFNENSIAKKYSSHHIIFVIIAYRLGIFGFISIGDGKAAAKNLAFHDMIAALQWVHDEISNFGGNPNRVTLMGHSGGATAVQLLSLCPRVPYRFFQQGISLSSADLYRKNLSNSMTMEIAYRVKCAERSVAYESEAVVECLRQKTASELLRHQKSLTDADYFDLMFGPEPDEELFPADIPVLLPRQNRRRMLLGITKHELALARFSSTAPQECKTFTTVFGYHTKQTRRACTDNYSFRKGKLLVMRDETRASVFRMAAKLALNNTPVYLYSFDMPGHDMHSGDLLFAMGTHPRKEMTDNEIAMNQIYPSYIRKFVTDGQPDSGWLPFDERRNNFMRITYETLANGSTINPHMTVGFYPNQIKLWLDHFGEVERAALEAQAKRAVLELQTIETNNDLGKDLGGINDLRWMSIFWISVAFGCMLIAAVILLGILLLINNGVPSFLRYKFKRHFAGERTRILTALNGKKYTLEEDGQELKFFSN